MSKLDSGWLPGMFLCVVALLAERSKLKTILYCGNLRRCQSAQSVNL